MGIEPTSNQKGECKLGKEITSNQKEEEIFSNEMDERKFIHNLQERKTYVVKMESASKGKRSLQ